MDKLHIEAADYVAHRSQKRMGVIIGLLAVLCLVLVFTDFGGLVPDDLSGRSARRGRSLEVLIAILPWLGGLGLLVCAVKVPSLFSSPIEIAISPDGITYPPALKETLPWDRIERVAIRKMSLYRVLSVFIKDEQSFPVKPFARKVAQMNKMSGDLGDINLETMRSDGDVDALIAAVEKYIEVEPLR